MESKRVLCCGARTWALGIGWLQTIFSVISLIAFIVYYILYTVASDYYSSGSESGSNFNSTDTDQDKEDDDLMMYQLIAIASMFIAVLTLLISFIAGTILIVGVKEENATKLKVWIIIQLIFLSFSTLELVLGLVFSDSTGFNGLIQNVLTIVVNIFFIWVVSIHRKELLCHNTGTGWVSFRTGKF